MLALVSAFSCGGAAYRSAEPGPHQNPMACIRPTSARFEFPPEPALEYVWDEPNPSKYPGLPEFSWEVSWDLPWGEDGTRPHALWLVTYWKRAGPHRGSLGAMLAAVAPTIMTADTTVTASVSIEEEDPAVTARLQRDQLVLQVEGASAIGRIFPVVPDSVTLDRRLGATAEEEQFRVQVQDDPRSCEPPA